MFVTSHQVPHPSRVSFPSGLLLRNPPQEVSFSTPPVFRPCSIHYVGNCRTSGNPADLTLRATNFNSSPPRFSLSLEDKTPPLPLLTFRVVCRNSVFLLFYLQPCPNGRRCLPPSFFSPCASFQLLHFIQCDCLPPRMAGVSASGFFWLFFYGIFPNPFFLLGRGQYNPPSLTRAVDRFLSFFFFRCVRMDSLQLSRLPIFYLFLPSLCLSFAKKDTFPKGLPISGPLLLLAVFFVIPVPL